MTNKPDWADEIAMNLEHENSSEGIEGGLNYYMTMERREVAAALRKAKADGVRSVARAMAESLKGHSMLPIMQPVIDGLLNEAAPAIERGE